MRRATLAKRATPLVFLKVALLCVLVAPQASTQGNCEVDQGLRDMVDDTFGRWTGGSAAEGGTSVYVCNISFIDGVNKTSLVSEEARLIDEAVMDGMQAAADTNPNIVINDPQHMTPKNDASVNRLAEISFDPRMSPDEKYSTAVGELMDPYGVHVLIAGLIVDTGKFIQMQPIGVSKPDKKISTKTQQYANRDEMFQEIGGTLALTQKAREEITKAVKDILDSV